MRPFTRELAIASLPALLALGAPRAVQAQRLVPGDTLRITTTTHSRFAGLLVSSDSTALVMLRASGRDTLRFFPDDMIKGEVLRGRHRRGAKTIGKGALIGLGVGSLLAAVVTRGYSEDNSDARELKAIASFGCIVVSTGTGTVIGTVAALRRVDHWVSFDPRSSSESSLQR